MLLLSTLNAHLSTCLAQGTAFTYQGRLNDGAAPANGMYDFRFRLFDAATNGNFSGGVVTLPTVGVSNGLFTVTLGFNYPNFDGSARWLDIGVRTNGSPDAYTNLVPRQAITPTPYAIYANTASNVVSGGLTGTYGNAVTFSNVNNNFSGAFNGNGANVTNVNAATLGGLTSAGFWKTNGNAGANPANGAFLGTTDTNSLEFKVNNQRALRIEYATHSTYGFSPNLVGGSSANMVSNGFVGAVIGGGGYSSFPNRVSKHFATVVGGQGNTASGDTSTTMGYGNTASGDYSTAIGAVSTASGYASIAMGNNAKALHEGSFVWADDQGVDFASTAVRQFCIRANGGVQLNGDTPVYFGSTLSQKLFLYGTDWGFGIQSGVEYARVGAGGGFAWYAGGVHNDNTYNPGAGGIVRMKLDSGGLVVNGTFVSASDRNAKENFAPVQPREVLEKVAALPLSGWNYKEDKGTRHIGPMAQDFYAAFNVGPDDKHIATVDEGGVALAAIQGLNLKVEEKEARIREQAGEITELKARLDKLEQLMNQKNGGAK